MIVFCIKGVDILSKPTGYDGIVNMDTKLRRTIRKYALGEAKLLDSIGMGFMEDRIRKSVIKIANEQQKNLTELTGIKPSLSEEEVNKYVAEVIQEIKKKPIK